jgi:GTP cyclohydrolase I
MEERNYNKVERFDAKAIEELKHHYTEILRLLGEDPAREGLQKTPERVAKAMSFLTKGYDENPLEIIRSATFREEYKQMVLVKDIELYSLCEHHMLPFYGKAHVAYIPNGHITGLSKIARVVECFARRLQVQERLTVQIRDCIQEALNPMGVAVVIEASHMCMQMQLSQAPAGSHPAPSAAFDFPLRPPHARRVHDPDLAPVPVDPPHDKTERPAAHGLRDVPFPGATRL